MCLALYLAASHGLPLIPWDEANPAFHVIRLPESADAVRKHFTGNYVYYAASAQGCSCAFNYEHEDDSILHLKNYLRNALICVEEVELFACQLNAEEQERQHALTSSPEGIALPDFSFKNGQYLTVRLGKSSQGASEAEKCLERVTKPAATLNGRTHPEPTFRSIAVRSVNHHRATQSTRR